MAHELKVPDLTTGLSTVAARLWSYDLTETWRVDNLAFETYASGDATHYRIAAAEVAGMPGTYVATMPSGVPAGLLFFDFVDVGNVPLSDLGEIDWNGTAELDPVAILNLLAADLEVDTTTTPWELVYLKKGTGLIGTGTELLRQKLYDASGSGIASPSTPIGRQVSV